MLVQLPDAIEIAGPGTSRIGIAEPITSKSHQGLKLPRNLQRVESQLLGCDNSGEESVQVHRGATALTASSLHQDPDQHHAIKKPARGPASNQ